MFTKDQVKIIQVFTSKISKSFSIRAVARMLKKDPSQIHKAMQPLLKKRYLLPTEQKQIRLNYRGHHQELAYIEYLRTEAFLKNNKVIKLLVEDVILDMKDEYFIMLLFGSAVERKKPRDIDILFIVDKPNNVGTAERLLFNITERYSPTFDINVISVDSVYEMVSKRDEKNVLNELLDKHLILYGGELFYRLLKNARR